MKKIKLFALLLVLTMVFAACGGQETSGISSAAEVPVTEVSAEASAEETPAEAPAEEEPYDEVFAVVHTNDVHGYIELEPYVKAVADELKTQYGEANVITVSAGDIYAGGNAVAHLYKGELIPPVMDAAGYDLLVPGNNDFNLGHDVLMSLTESAAHVKTICANLYEKLEDGTSGETVFPRSAEFTTEGGTKVGFFGVTVSGGAIADSYGNPGTLETAQEMTAELQAAGCTVIIGVGHTGWNDDLVTPATNDITSAGVAQGTPGLDAYVDGHSHSFINGGDGWICPETGTLVNQASCKGECLGVMTFYLKDGKVVDKNARLIMGEELTSYTPDGATKELVDAAFARLAEDTGDAYIVSEYFQNGLRTSESSDGRSIRTDETNLGDMITDGLRHATGADIAMVAGYRLRASIPEGPITSVNLYDVFANGADIYIMELTGQEVLDKMANCLIDLPNESTQFNQWSGVSYGYVVGADRTYTIVNPTVGGEPLELEKTYAVAIDLGGPDAPADQEPVISGMEAAAEAVGAYLASGEATLWPDEPTPDNRIVPMTEIPADAVTYEVAAAMSAPPDGGGTPPDGMGGAGGTPPDGTPPDGFGGGELGVPPA